MENRQEQVSKQGLSTGKRDQHSSGGSPPNKKKKNRPLEDENEDICVTYSASCDVDSIECESCLKLQHRQCAGMQKSTRYRTRRNFNGGGGDLANHTVDFTIFEKSQLAVKHSVDDPYE